MTSLKLDHELDRPAGMSRDHRVNEVAPHRLQARQGPGFVDPHKVRVADDIRR
jgi:hypothetical protein